MSRSWFDDVTRELARRTSRRDVLRLISLGSLAMLAPTLAACTHPACPAPCGDDCCSENQTCLDGACRPASEAVTGQYQTVSYRAEVLGPQAAMASFSTDGADEFHVVVTATDRARLNFRGTSVDGFGALNESERAALQTLNTAPFRDALRMIPLELACQRGDLHPAIFAALLFPWQLVHKYLTHPREAALEEYTTRAPCLTLPSLFELSRMQRPLPAYEILPRHFPFPHAGEYMPLDGTGWLEGSDVTSAALLATAVTAEATAQVTPVNQRTESPRGPDGAPCRGACGPDCSPNNYSQHPGSRVETVCTVNADGKQTGEIEEWGIYELGLHEGCVVHDQCYDDCVDMNGLCENKWGIPGFCFDSAKAFVGNFACYRACDSDCLTRFGSRCLQWARGYGPYDSTGIFEYKLSTRPAPDVCIPDPNIYEDGPPPDWGDWQDDDYVPCSPDLCSGCHRCGGNPCVPGDGRACNAECCPLCCL